MAGSCLFTADRRGRDGICKSTLSISFSLSWVWARHVSIPRTANCGSAGELRVCQERMILLTEVCPMEEKVTGTSAESTALWQSPYVRIENISRYDGQTVVLKGWLNRKSSTSKVFFLIMRDGSGSIQLVVDKEKAPEALLASVKELSQECSFEIAGKVRKEERAACGYEIDLLELKLISGSVGYPITNKQHGTDFLMDKRHLWIRSQRQHAILRIRAEIIRSISEWLDTNGFLRVDSPILTPNSCEGTSTLFETDYFDTKAYLSQSGQLYGEAAAMAFGKIYCFGPTFRAEKSKTRRHLTEFWMVEPEMAFTDLDGCMEVEEQLISHIAANVLKNRMPELKVLKRDISKLECIKAPFPRMSYDEAAEYLKSKEVSDYLDSEEGKAYLADQSDKVRESIEQFQWGDDFGALHETIISRKFDRPVFVHHYPCSCKAFYMKPEPGRPEVCRSVDLLAPEGYGEIAGGSQRIDDYELLESRIRENNLSLDAYQWYLDLRRYGSVPHSGFGIGVERTVAWMCGIEHVRETIPYARTMNRLAP